MKSLSVKLGVILIGLVIFGYAEAREESWKYVDQAYAGMYYYDADRIKRQSEDIVRVWMKVLYTENGVHNMVRLLGKNFETLSYAIALFECHCGDKKKEIVPMGFYSEDSKLLLSAKQISNWNFMSPDTIDEALCKILCEQPNKTKMQKERR